MSLFSSTFASSTTTLSVVVTFVSSVLTVFADPPPHQLDLFKDEDELNIGNEKDNEDSDITKDSKDKEYEKENNNGLKINREFFKNLSSNDSLNHYNDLEQFDMFSFISDIQNGKNIGGIKLG